MIEYLHWDSEFFGIRIGKAVIFSAEDWNKVGDTVSLSNDYDLIYVFDHSLIKPVHYLSQKMDTKVVYEKQVVKIQESPNRIREYQSDLPDEDIYGLAIVSGGHSRYFHDNNFPSGVFEQLYRKWIENSVNGSIADAVFVYENNGHTKGMVTIKIKDCVGTIGLIAVSPAFQCYGIGTELLKSVENYLFNREVRTLRVETQLDNIGACNFYEKNGFEIVSQIDVYHLWLQR